MQTSETAHELEMSVIGGLLLSDGEEREAAFARLTPKCFESKELRKAYCNLREQHQEIGECDAIVAAEGLLFPGILAECMDIAAIKGLLPYHATKLFDRYRRRVLARQMEEVNSGVAFGEPLSEILSKLTRALETQAKLDEIQDNSTSLGFVDSVIEYLGSLYAKSDLPVQTGVPLLDYILSGGYRPKSVNIISGRPGSGKSDFAVYLAVKMAVKGARVLYLTMEMPRTQIMERIASSLTGIDSADLADRREQGSVAYANRYACVIEALDKLSEIPLTFDEEQNLSPEDVERKIRQHRPEVVIIDHLGLMRRDPKKQPWQNAFDSSQELKKIAMKENIVLVELVQQNSEIEKRARKKAILSDLKGSDGLGNDADTVTFISTEKAENILSGEEAVAVTLEIVKNRHGKIGKIPFRWQPQYHRYIPVNTRYER